MLPTRAGLQGARLLQGGWGLLGPRDHCSGDRGGGKTHGQRALFQEEDGSLACPVSLMGGRESRRWVQTERCLGVPPVGCTSSPSLQAPLNHIFLPAPSGGFLPTVGSEKLPGKCLVLVCQTGTGAVKSHRASQRCLTCLRIPFMSGGERGTPGPLLPRSLHQAGAAFYLGAGKKGRAKEERNEDAVPAHWHHATEQAAGSCAALGVSPLGPPYPQPISLLAAGGSGGAARL